ncbi:hypothetical protein [Aquimarina brevivitae]|uniref:Uncharacterized protein n=1 Tax=Aquimarina brevivitae TaxID=323412 RepID=A0A4Q7P1U5_9FLAO|nr:hypothetical protein [Aquimarina brevivitae]RZS93547.1 hypothetical protein EV197_2127 [Aquimarina brevivitae]
MKQFTLLIFAFVLGFTNVQAQEDDNSANDFYLIIGIYDGFKNDTYSFTYLNKTGEEAIIFFNKVSSNVLQSFNLKDNSAIGGKFEIAYLATLTSDQKKAKKIAKERTIIDLKPMRSFAGL